ncbi:MAG: hypothetical protein H6619_03140 [Deltaproteobacteria bacterium]|nr:hypothetical protein [Deltaproteobacteria bacterium]
MRYAPRKKQKQYSGALDLYKQSSWDRARRYARVFGPVPGVISYAIKVLRQNHFDNLQNGTQSIDPESISAIKLIDLADTLKNPLYFGAASLFPEEFGKSKDDRAATLLQILTPGVFAALLLLTYILRRAQFATDNKGLKDVIEGEFLLNTEIGFTLGSEIPEIGMADGTFLGGLRFVALAALLIKDPSGYEKYREEYPGTLDPVYERKHFGCDHAQIGAYIIQMFQYTKSPIFHLREALLGMLHSNYTDMKTMPIWASTISAFDSLKKDDKLVNFGCLEVSDMEEKVLQSVIKNISIEGSSFRWLCKEFDHEIPVSRAGETNIYTDQELNPEDVKIIKDLEGIISN